ncbi:hypothetical protein Q1695_006200 [Nippostrongylus brasiliensis]|nr:hypothetical protein Q1695_006200 [Nippostrongylus brasiliensis]
MTNGSAPLSAAERRERRLKRILGDGENRIKKILSGPDGTEERLAPVIEGGEYNFPLFANGSVPDTETVNDVSMPKVTPPSTCSQLLSGFQRLDLPLAVVYGISVAIAMTHYDAFNILLPWLLLFFGSRLPGLVHEVPNFFKDIRRAINSKDLLVIESLMKRSCTSMALLNTFLSRFVVMVATFLVTHSIIIITYGS